MIHMKSYMKTRGKHISRKRSGKDKKWLFYISYKSTAGGSTRAAWLQEDLQELQQQRKAGKSIKTREEVTKVSNRDSTCKCPGRTRSSKNNTKHKEVFKET